jgi:hypothetical protein
MSKTPFFSFVALLLVVFIAIPSIFLVVPQRVNAQVPTLETNPAIVGPTPVTGAETTLTAVQTILGNVYKYTSMVADVANWINTNILQPLAFVMSGNLMKMLTASVVKFVVGTANGTGAPQFVANTQKSLQQLSDMKAGAYISQMGITGSPFASSIAVALGLNYSYSTSLGGYWQANMNTLRAGSRGISNSANIPAYLAGNWLQGGVAAWLALTTVPSNNPYMLYQNSQAKLSSLIGPGTGGATGARLSELSWGQGMMSWCGTSDAATYKQNAASTALQACRDQCDNQPGGYTAACSNHCDAAYSQNGGNIASGGINPGDPCTKTDGSGLAGTIQTPGSTIKATLDKVLGGQQDKLVQMGNISGQITGILGNIGSIVNTINLASNILGGGSTGGLYNAGQPSGALSTFGAPTDTTQASLTTGYGVSQSSIESSATTSKAAIAAANPADAGAANANAIANAAAAGAAAAYPPGSTDLSATALIAAAQTRVQKYQIAWSSINISAQDAKTALTTMATACHSINTTEEGLATTAIINEVNPVLGQVTSANGVVTAAQAQITSVQNESTTASTTYAADVQALSTMRPTSSELQTAQIDAQSANGYGVIINSSNPLSVSGGSIVDQMSRLKSQAEQLQQTYCTSYTGSGA